MKFIIDTNVLIFLGTGKRDRISDDVMNIYGDQDSQIYISQVSFWEIAIKINIGKLHIPTGLGEIIVRTRDVGIETISIKNIHTLNYAQLPRFDNHKDPFDRLIVSTAQTEKLPIISNDRNFDLYQGVERLW